jgi:hypothetical protein
MSQPAQSRIALSLHCTQPLMMMLGDGSDVMHVVFMHVLLLVQVE